LLRLLTVVSLSLIGLAGIPAEAKSHPAHKNSTGMIQTIRAVFETPDDALDLARAKLTFDKIVDPSIDVDATLRQIDQMAQTVKTMAGPNAPEMQKLTAVRRFIYVDGDWNGHQPFQYDLVDPL